jgi:hypothetical protein
VPYLALRHDDLSINNTKRRILRRTSAPKIRNQINDPKLVRNSLNFAPHGAPQRDLSCGVMSAVRGEGAENCPL